MTRVLKQEQTLCLITLKITFLKALHLNRLTKGNKLKPFFSARLNPNGENQTHVGGTFDFKDIVEIGGGYKSLGYSNVLLVVKTKFGLTAAYAYDFGIPSGQAAVTKSGNEIFLKFKF